MKTIFLFMMAIVFVFSDLAHAQNLHSDSLLKAIDQNMQEQLYDEANRLYQETLPLLLQEKDSLTWFSESINYADNLIRTGEVKAALGMFKMLDSIHVADVPFEASAKVKRQIGYSYRLLERYDPAMKYYLEGMELAEQKQDSSVMAYFHNNMGIVLQKKGEYDRAFQHFSEALAYHESAGNKVRIGKISNGIFLNLMSLGLANQAEPYIQRSLQIFEELQHLRDLDIAYHNLAWNFENRDRLDSAIIYYNKSLELTRQLGNPFEVNRTLLNIGSLYQQIGEYSSAKQFFEEALEISRETSRQLSVAESLVLLAENALATGNDSQSEKYFEEAYSIFSNHNLPDKLIFMNIHLADFELKRQNYDKASRYISEAEKISRDLNLTRNISSIYQLKGEIDFASGNIEKSIPSFKKALDNARNKNEKINSLKFLAKAYHQFSSDSAFIFAEDAIRIIDELSERITGFTFGAGSFSNHSDFYNELAFWYLSEKNDSKRAFELIEASKARILLDELARSQNEAFSALGESEQVKKQQKVNHLNSLYNELETESDPQKLAKLQTELRQAELDYQAYLNVVNLSNPVSKTFRRPAAINIEDAQNLLDKHSAIIEFAFSDSNLISFFITKDGVATQHTEMVKSQSALEFVNQSVTELLNMVENVEDEDLIKESSADLYNLLIGDFLRKNPRIKNLLVVSAGPISYLPFELLYHSSSYLAENYVIKYAPSVSILPFIKEPHRNETGLLAMAGAGLSSSQITQKRTQNSYASLPYSILEVQTIAHHFDSTLIYMDDQLNEAELKAQNLSEFRFLHFATHGKIDLENPTQSGLLISGYEDEFSAEDGFLNNLEISLLNIDADLVVLSACKTGIGKRYSGEGLFGLQRSFLIAGASGVVVSLWDVYDRSTAEFMDHFYSKMLEYQNEDYGFLSKSLSYFGLYKHPLFDYKARAFQSAKEEMINHPYYHHPVHWAPFILIGK